MKCFSCAEIPHLCPVSPEDSQTSVLLSQGSFSWQEPSSPNEEEESGGAKGSLQLHSLNLNITKVQATIGIVL